MPAISLCADSAGWANCIHLLLSPECKVRWYNGLMGSANEAVVSDACGRQR
jgi:hypothetical protein